MVTESNNYLSRVTVGQFAHYFLFPLKMWFVQRNTSLDDHVGGFFFGGPRTMIESFVM